MYRLAIFTSHPIQYQGPFFKAIAQSGEIELKVYFASNFGAEKEEYDPEFGRKIKWDIPILEGYPHEFLRNVFALPTALLFSRQKFDAIMVFGWNSFASLMVFFAAFFSKTPVLLRGENPLSQELLRPQNLKLKAKKLFFRWFFRKIAGFLYIGEENRKFYEYYGASPERMFFAPYAVDNERFLAEAKKLLPHKSELKEKLGIPPEKVVILFVGKLIPKKRPMDLLRAFESLIANYQLRIAPHLIFVGDGVLRPELEKYSKEHNLGNVHFVGFKNQTELPEYYAMADIFVLPSGVGETWGLVVNEAMCFSLPVILSDIVGCGTDLVYSGENGYIFSTGNVHALTECLNLLCADSVKIKKFGEKSRKRIGVYNYERDREALLRCLKKI